MRVCPGCGGRWFEGRRREVRTMVVDSCDGRAAPEGGGPDGWASEALTIGERWGPYVCLGCGLKVGEVDDLPETTDVGVEGERVAREGSEMGCARGSGACQRRIIHSYV